MMIAFHIDDERVWHCGTGMTNHADPMIMIPVSTLDGMSDEDILDAVKGMIDRAWYTQACAYTDSALQWNINSKDRYKYDIVRWADEHPEKIALMERFKDEDEDIARGLQNVADCREFVRQREEEKAKSRAKRPTYPTRKDAQSRYSDLFVKVGRRDGFQCAICKHTGNDLQVDHIHPVSKGGTNDLANLQLLCPSCNMSKGNRTP